MVIRIQRMVRVKSSYFFSLIARILINVKTVYLNTWYFIEAYRKSSLNKYDVPVFF